MTRLRHMLRERDVRGATAERVLSVYREHGVIPKDDRTDNYNKTPSDLSGYKLVRPGDVVINKMKAWQGSLGVSAHRGIVSGDYLVCEITSDINRRYLHHLLRSRPLVQEFAQRSSGIRPSQWRLYWEDLSDIDVRLPSRASQDKIADFLDAETDRIDRLIGLRIRSRELQSERFESAVFAAVSGGLRPGVPKRPSGLQWVDPIPAHWGTPTVSVNFELALGKMLNAESAAGPAQHPYLRNVNVQWDRIDLGDLATMSFDEKEFFRYGLRSGDVLICEGGEVGRAAVWASELDKCFIQKAIHRARPRRGANGRYLMYCLRAAAKRSVFSVEGNQSTIVHLTGEQLRVHRFPWPPPDEQRDIVEHLDRLAEHHASISRAMDAHVALLQERKQALITAAVTGQLGLAREFAEGAS